MFPLQLTSALFVWILYSPKQVEKGTSKKAYCKTINTKEGKDQSNKEACIFHIVQT